MNKLSKDKRNQLVLVALGTAAVVAGLWFLLLSAQLQKIAQVEAKKADVQREITAMEDVKRGEKQIEADLAQYGSRLGQIENAMPSGDLYSWMNLTLNSFNVPGYKVEMPSVSYPMVGEVALFPGFPYNQAAVNVSGSGFYEDFGRFVADFENRFPYMRLQNLSLEPGASLSADDREKLSFRMEIISVIRANSL